MRAWLICGALLITACKRDEPKQEPAKPPPPAAKAPIRGAAGDQDLRVLLADVASAKACEMIRGQFRALRAPDRPGVATGTLWIRDCKITNEGTRATYRITGNGWQWADQTKKQAGATFEVKQYVKFAVDVTIPGSFDIAYDRGEHIVSLWFSPSGPAKVDFTPVGEVDVDRKGVWSSILGAIASVFADSPEEKAADEAKKQGTGEIRDQLADGLAVTIDLCTGLSRFNLGRRPKGKMQKPDVGETRRVPVELHPGGVMIGGPQIATNGMTVHAEATSGAVRMELVCAEHAERVALGMMDGAGPEPPPAPVLGAIDVRGKATMQIKPVKCPVLVVARPLGEQPATVAWLRPASETARSTGGPLLRCK